MKIRLISIFMVITGSFFITDNCWAFRCGSDLVSSGDSRIKVQVTCGKPTSKGTSCENQQEYTTTNKSGKIKKFKKCGKKLEVWHYNCGDNDFIYKLTFENGVLKSENTAGRGKGKSDCKGK